MLDQQQENLYKFSAVLHTEIEEERSNTHSSPDVLHGLAIVPELMCAPLLMIL